jgi:hypothetical protein
MDFLLSIVIFLIQKLLMPVLPSSLPFLSISTFSGFLSGVQNNLTYALSGLGFFMPVDLLLSLILIVFVAEAGLLLFKIGTFLINLGRGSGA